MHSDQPPGYQVSLRRLRASAAVRDLVKQVHLSHRSFIQPHFIVEGIGERQVVASLPGVYRENADSLLKQIDEDLKAGINKILLFAVPDEKKSSQWQFDFQTQQIAKLKQRFGSDLWIACDICLCSWSDHGHCGVMDADRSKVLNAPTVAVLADQALCAVQAGVDCVAPSDMMDGRIGAIRAGLRRAGCDGALIMSYAAKFHSYFYGPFRDAAESAPKNVKLANRATYQIDPANPGDALASALRDAEEGADILMVKPGLPYLDVLQDLSSQITLPWAVYQVSGECAAIELMAEKGLMQRSGAYLETWYAFARAGANMTISYAARSARQWIEEAQR